MVYFVPQDRTSRCHWRERVGYYAQRIERFHAREFDGLSRLTVVIREQPFLSPRSSAELRAGDADFIFFETLREVESALAGEFPQPGVFPVLLVLSDINWRELDDFYRLRLVGASINSRARSSTAGTFRRRIGGRPLVVSAGARTRLGTGQRGWLARAVQRFRLRGLPRGCGTSVGLPHPDPGDGSVMSLAQYQFWINQSWVEESQRSNSAGDRGRTHRQARTTCSRRSRPYRSRWSPSAAKRYRSGSRGPLVRGSSAVPRKYRRICLDLGTRSRSRRPPYPRNGYESARLIGHTGQLPRSRSVGGWPRGRVVGLFSGAPEPGPAAAASPAHRSDTPLAATVAPRWDEPLIFSRSLTPPRTRCRRVVAS